MIVIVSLLYLHAGILVEDKLVHFRRGSFKFPDQVK